jgi:hypothetical protein
VTAFGVDPGYNATIFNGPGRPLGGQRAFGGMSPGFPALQPLVLDFGHQLAGRSFQIRFRMGTDFALGIVGWILDDITVRGLVNTPFPTLVAEPSICTARQAPVDDSAVIATTGSPSVSLAAFDGGVCIRADQ